MHYLILSGVLALLVKVVWDWLANGSRKKENCRNADAIERIEIALARMETIQEEMRVRQCKIWEHQLGEK